MVCLEISGRALADMIQVPFMQRECDPVYRFPEALEHDRNPPASLYVLSARAGAFTLFHVDSSAEVHWIRVVSGEKWVYLLPPTKHNLKQYKKGNDTRGDLLWLADNCPKTPVASIVLKDGQSLLFPSRYIHAVLLFRSGGATINSSINSAGPQDSTIGAAAARVK
ncbi:JmjC domain-containing histone demethylation protein 1 [Naganishia albida]|nr:JmjC domain-containing histone demethylation protein 1 [Naganishia albida]